MVGRALVQMLIQGAQVVGRAFTQAVKQEIKYSEEAAKRAGGGAQGQRSATNDLYHGMSLQEAKQVLNVKDITDETALRKSYDHLFKVNDKVTGGSFYLQSKVVRAKERIEQELMGASPPDPPTAEEQETNTNKPPS